MTSARTRNPVDVRVYLVGGDTGGRDLAQVAAAAVAGGTTVVQARDKSVDHAALAAQTAALQTRLGDRVPVIVNDDAAVAATARAGLHVGPDDQHPAEARRLLGPGAIIGWSIHDPAQLADTAAVAACDYLAASPVWPTPSKTDTTAPLGPAGVRALRAAMPADLPLVAIGGIDQTNAAAVIAAGADGVAVISAICAADDPRAAAARLRAVVDRALADRIDTGAAAPLPLEESR